MRERDAPLLSSCEDPGCWDAGPTWSPSPAGLMKEAQEFEANLSPVGLQPQEKLADRFWGRELLFSLLVPVPLREQVMALVPEDSRSHQAFWFNVHLGK